MKISIIIVFLLLSLRLFSQGNLQFNQVLLLNATANNTSQWTVPAGKTWKIETMGSYSSTMYVYLNNSMAFEYIGDFNNNFGAYYRGSDAPALWIPSGTVLGHSSSNGSAFRYFSVLEFNIIP
jgi:beta-galactosidase/beta-glucuronidase